MHSDEALLAVGFIFTIHFFNTHLRPEKFPMDMVMLTGLVGEEELRGHRIELAEVDWSPFKHVHVKAELQKVTWPTREEGIRLTWIVFVVTVISAIVLFGVDSLFAAIIGFLIRAS